MTKKLSPQAIDELLAMQIVELGIPAVTIYFPLHQSGTAAGANEDRIRSKNLIHEALQQLSGYVSGNELAKQLIAWHEELLARQDFWESRTPGLLLCARPGFLRAYYLPIATEEHVAVGDRFQLAQVLAFAQEMRDYYVLTLAQHEPKLYYADAYGLQPQPAVGFPSTLITALNIDETAAIGEQQRSSAGGASFNGRGGVKDAARSDRLKFWRLLDRRLLRFTNYTNPKPLILAGVEPEISEFRSISHYPRILHATIAGNLAKTPLPKLFEQASRIERAELTDSDRTQAINDYHLIKGQSPAQAAYKLGAIRAAAENGRVATLFLPTLEQTTDLVGESMQAGPRFTFPFGDSVAQGIHDIASMVFSTRGRVIELATAQMPEPGALAVATLRY